MKLKKNHIHAPMHLSFFSSGGGGGGGVTGGIKQQIYPYPWELDRVP